jgi:hypothetical protein
LLLTVELFKHPLNAGRIRRDKKERNSFLSRFAVVAFNGMVCVSANGTPDSSIGRTNTGFEHQPKPSIALSEFD